MAKIIKIKELAKLYKVHRNTIRNWIGYYFDENNDLDLHQQKSVDKFQKWCETRLVELGRKEI